MIVAVAIKAAIVRDIFQEFVDQHGRWSFSNSWLLMRALKKHQIHYGDLLKATIHPHTSSFLDRRSWTQAQRQYKEKLRLHLSFHFANTINFENTTSIMLKQIKMAVIKCPKLIFIN